MRDVATKACLPGPLANLDRTTSRRRENAGENRVGTELDLRLITTATLLGMWHVVQQKVGFCHDTNTQALD